MNDYSPPDQDPPSLQPGIFSPPVEDVQVTDVFYEDTFKDSGLQTTRYVAIPGQTLVSRSRELVVHITAASGSETFRCSSGFCS